MVDITALNGVVQHVSDDSITMITAPYPHDPANVGCHVIGATPAPLLTSEAGAALVARLRPAVLLAQMTRPDGSAVWVKGAAVMSVRAPIADETPPGETVGSIIYVGARHQAVREDLAAASAIINAHGGNV